MDTRIDLENKEETSSSVMYLICMLRKYIMKKRASWVKSKKNYRQQPINIYHIFEAILIILDNSPTSGEKPKSILDTIYAICNLHPNMKDLLYGNFKYQCGLHVGFHSCMYDYHLKKQQDISRNWGTCSTLSREKKDCVTIDDFVNYSSMYNMILIEGIFRYVLLVVYDLINTPMNQWCLIIPNRLLQNQDKQRERKVINQFLITIFLMIGKNLPIDLAYIIAQY